MDIRLDSVAFGLDGGDEGEGSFVVGTASSTATIGDAAFSTDVAPAVMDGVAASADSLECMNFSS